MVGKKNVTMKANNDIKRISKQWYTFIEGCGRFQDGEMMCLKYTDTYTHYIYTHPHNTDTHIQPSQLGKDSHGHVPRRGD